MNKAQAPNEASIGRFDQSFLIHMIKDFFVILVLVTALEFALKAVLVYYEFAITGPDRTENAAQEIAENVRSIMINEGGPVAVTTIYPILRTNWEKRGYLIAIEPSDVTRKSVEDIFGYSPEGISMSDVMEDRRATLASVDVHAEEFCLTCHVDAEVGDVLGTVTVKGYLSTQFAAWWKSVQVGLGLAVGKIILHSVLLFILLRSRLEPLLQLRAVVSSLARAFGGLDQRAEIRSADEFGALARDLNLFLNRVERLIKELDHVLQRVVSVNNDILLLQSDLRERMDTLSGTARDMERRALMGAKQEPRLSREWFEMICQVLRRFESELPKTSDSEDSDLSRLLKDLRTVIANAEAQIHSNEKLYEDLIELGVHTEGFQDAMEKMIRLEERMNVIIEAGGVLVNRLSSADSRDTSPPGLAPLTQTPAATTDG